MITSDKSIVIAENKNLKKVNSVAFYIKSEFTQIAAEHLINILSDDIVITLNDDAKFDGVTEFTLTGDQIKFRTNGIGSSGEWLSISKERAIQKMKMLSHLNDGSSESKKGSVKRVPDLDHEL